MKIPITITMMAATMAAIVGFTCPRAQAQDIFVDLELSLVIDVSGSVDPNEYILQLEGYAKSFESSSLQTAISAGGQGQIAVNMVQFSSGAAESIGWTLISDSTSSNAFAQALRSATRLFDGGTNIDAGINTAYPLFATNGYSAPRQVIDVSGDGSGGATGAARDAALAAGIDTINGIVIGGSVSVRETYENFVISPDGFVEEAPTFAEFEPAVLRKLTREISGDNGSALPVAATLHNSSIGIVRSQTRDIGRRIARLRAGVPATMVQPEAAPAMTDSKGGMAKGGIVAAAPYPRRWEVYGGINYYSEDGDRQDVRVPGTGGTTFIVPVMPDYEMDVFGGNVGIEYRINDNWSIGGAFAASNADLDFGPSASADIDSMALIPYVSYVRRDVFAGADYYADLLYAHSWLDYDTRRSFGGKGSTDGDADQVEINTGLNFKSASLVHGPYAVLRWIDGSIESYQESGGTVFPDTDYESLATNLGYQVSYPISLNVGTLVLQSWAAWEHEFEDDGPTVFGVPLSGVVDEDLAVLGLGVGWYAAPGWNLGLDYEGRFGSNIESHYVGLKAGYEF